MSRPLPRLLDRVAEALEGATVLDRVADVIGPATAFLQRKPLDSLLSGTDAGHPIHPALVLVPAGSWLGATTLDASGRGYSRAAQRLIAVGTVAAVPAAVTGAADWSYTEGAERRIGVAHAMANWVAVALYGASYLRRRAGRSGRILSAAGAVSVAASGWLGGHLAYARGVGVDTTAFQSPPADWFDVCPEAELTDGEPRLVHAGAVPVLLVRTDGTLHAIADRCTHRGAPLHEGPLSDGVVECPWHASRFCVADGSILDGPASRPQPVYEVRTRYGSVQIRKADEPVALRSNPVH